MAVKRITLPASVVSIGSDATELIVAFRVHTSVAVGLERALGTRRVQTRRALSFV